MNVKNLKLAKLGSLIVACLGFIAQGADQVQALPAGLLPASPWAHLILGWVGVAGLCAHAILNNIHTNQLQALQNAVPGSPTAAPSAGVKTGLFLIGFLLLGSIAQAQTPTATVQPSVILRYANLTISKETISTPVVGTFAAPLAQVGFEAFSVQNDVLTVGQSESLDFAYSLMPNATVTADGSGGVNVAPKWYGGAFIGGVLIQQNSVDFGHANWGFFLGKADLLGPVAPAISEDLATHIWSAGAVVNISFDVLGGTGLIQL